MTERGTRRLCGVGLLVALCVAIPLARGGEQALAQRQARIYAQTCAHCHARPGLGVPVVGVEQDWVARRERGLESMLSNTVNGMGNMPPLGTCGYCTEADFRALVAFLAGMAAE